jgi:hypothetical protein
MTSQTLIQELIANTWEARCNYPNNHCGIRIYRFSPEGKWSMRILSEDTLGDVVHAVLGGTEYGGRWKEAGSEYRDWLTLEVLEQKVGLIGSALRFPNAFSSTMAFIQAKARFPGYRQQLTFARLPDVHHGNDIAAEGVYSVTQRGRGILKDHREIWSIRRAPVL